MDLHYFSCPNMCKHLFLQRVPIFYLCECFVRPASLIHSRHSIKSGLDLMKGVPKSMLECPFVNVVKREGGSSQAEKLTPLCQNPFKALVPG